MAIVRKLIDVKRFIMHQNEANKQHFVFIGWLYHPEGLTPHSMTKTAKIDQNWLPKRLPRQIFIEFSKNYNIRNRVSNCIGKRRGAIIWNKKFKKGATWLHMLVQAVVRVGGAAPRRHVPEAASRSPTLYCRGRYPSSAGLMVVSSETSVVEELFIPKPGPRL